MPALRMMAALWPAVRVAREPGVWSERTVVAGIDQRVSGKFVEVSRRDVLSYESLGTMSTRAAPSALARLAMQKRREGCFTDTGQPATGYNRAGASIGAKFDGHVVTRRGVKVRMTDHGKAPFGSCPRYCR